MAQTKSWTERRNENHIHKYGGSLTIGAILLLLGIIFTLDQLGWRAYWPVTLIVGGLAITFWAAVNRGKALSKAHEADQAHI